MDLSKKDYVVIVQCHLVKQRCSGYSCEKAFHERKGGMADYPKDRPYRTLYMTCGGCCGRALHRKLTNLTSHLRKSEKMAKDRIVVQLSTCITRDNFHAPPCPHLDYLAKLIGKIGLDWRRDTWIDAKAETRRREGVYDAG